MSNDPTDELRELELLSRHLDGELSDEERAALQRRLDDEPALARQLEELRGVVDQLDALAPTEPPALDWEHLALPSSAAEVVRASPTPANRPWLWVAAVAAAAIALVASWPSPEELVLANGVAVVEGDRTVLAGDLRIAVDGRAAIAVEPPGGVPRGGERHLLEEPMDTRTILAGLAGAVVTVTVYEGTALVARAGEPATELQEGAQQRFGAPESPGTRVARKGGSEVPVLPAPGPERDAALEARVEELQAELADIEGELETERFGAALMRGQLKAEQGEVSEWPDDVADALTEAGLRQDLVPQLEGLGGFSVAELDCYEFPCVVALRYEGDDDSLEWGRPVGDVVGDWAEGALDNANISMNQSIFRDDEGPESRFVLFSVDDGSVEGLGDRTKWRMDQLGEQLGDDARSAP